MIPFWFVFLLILTMNIKFLCSCLRFRWSMWSEKWIYGQLMRYWSYSASLYLLVFQFLKVKSESFGFICDQRIESGMIHHNMFLWICNRIGNARKSWERLLLALSLLLQGALKCLIFFKLRISLVQNMEKNLSWLLLSFVPILVSIVLLVYLGAGFFFLMFYILFNRNAFLNEGAYNLLDCSAFLARSLKSFLLLVHLERQGSRC